jgi:phosphoglucomutase
MSDLNLQLNEAVASGKLLDSSAKNILQLLASSRSTVDAESIRELVSSGAWTELNDRFFRTLAFGTGGLRGRTIGRTVTRAELGEATPNGRPQQPCTGTNAMNYYNISRATQGLVAYLKEHFIREKRAGKPKIAIAHDTRHFSREFAELTAKVAVELGCDACLFDAPRSTPELSFAVRYTGSTAGIVITASHNPPHDNGYKCYFEDGAQVVEPHAGGIIAKVNVVASEVYEPLEKSEQGALHRLGSEIDDAYMQRLETLVLDPGMVKKQNDLRIIFTPIHGTGGAIVNPMLARLGFHCETVPEQDVMDGRFPTVKSPNPENAEALAMGVELAKKTGADLVIATDPDADRMGVAVRNSAGGIQLFSGNQIGSLMAYYRTKTLIDQGVITKENLGRCAIIKTFVTTDLQKAIAEKYGVRCVETLTGFKYIGAKLGKYEDALPESDRAHYRELTEAQTRKLRLEKSTYYVFGGEESYGYSAHDFVRDKDANASAVMFAEVAAYAKSRGLTLDGLLDEIYSEFGFYLEKNAALTFEGAEGAGKIKKLAESYASNPPTEIDGVAVSGVVNFGNETILDVEGDRIPSEAMLIISLVNGSRIAVRPSGTEPKIKFYLFAKREPGADGKFSTDQLAAIKKEIASALESLWLAVQSDAEKRIAA